MLSLLLLAIPAVLADSWSLTLAAPDGTQLASVPCEVSEKDVCHQIFAWANTAWEFTLVPSEAPDTPIDIVINLWPSLPVAPNARVNKFQKSVDPRGGTFTVAKPEPGLVIIVEPLVRER
ncbi:MAG: hypothetical protein JXB39_12910 [Deltaproteobacteria bacterium]|nr:hypothetical protein [Deltaproteobacteria bacterium]